MLNFDQLAREAGQALAIDRRALNLAHLRMTIDEAMQHAQRAMTEAEAIDAPVTVRDGLFIALTRLTTAKTNCKE